MKEVYDLIKKHSSLPLMAAVKAMNQHEVYNLARYMYWSSSCYNQQIDRYFNDSRYRNIEHIFVTIIFTLKPYVTSRYQFNYIDMATVMSEYEKLFPYDSSTDNFRKMVATMLDNIHIGDPLAVAIYRMLMTKPYKKRFSEFIQYYLAAKNPRGLKQYKLSNMYALFWHLSEPQQCVEIPHAEAIATYNTAVAKEIENHSFFDFMDKLL